MTGANLLLGIMVSASLSACSSQGERDVVSDDPLAIQTAAKEDQFGKGFGKAFRADPNSEPANVSDADLHPVSYTAEPLDVD